MLRSVIVCSLLFTLPVARGQSSARVGILEPPELAGEPKKFVPPSEVDRQFFEAIKPMKDDEASAKATIPLLDAFIAQHPDYSDAYVFRATLKKCYLPDPDFASITSDVRLAMSHAGNGLYKTADYYSMFGKIALETGKYAEALEDLQTAIKSDLSNASSVFNASGVEPAKTSKSCEWNLTDLDTLVAKFPQDYRSWLIRGLYYNFFTTFKEDFFVSALQQFQKAASLNPKSPYPQYFIGSVYNKSSFWSPKAASSDAIRDQAIRNAIQEYTRAILADPKFAKAYEMRAGCYLNLKQYPQAIKDFDKVLSFDPENSTAYADRGLAKLEAKEYRPAISDFNDAIRLKGDGNFFSAGLYEDRGDGDIALGNFQEAVNDYSQAIKLHLANSTISFSVKQIRALYPEYDKLSDAGLIRRINELFWPQFDYESFAKQLNEHGGKGAVTFSLSELYEKRGDAYLKFGNYERGAQDFKRIYNGIPNMASSTDRWRSLGGSSAGDEWYLDVKSFESSSDGPVRLWVKSVGKKESQTISYEFDCKNRRIKATSGTVYNREGKIVRSSEENSGWARIIPDSIGERIYEGACFKQ